MKTLKNIIAALALVVVSSNMIAGNKPSSNLVNEIKNNVTYTSVKSGESKKVTFTFTVNELGKVNAVAAKVENKDERAALETQFAKLTFAKLAQGVTYSIDVNFINY
jgi:hypothetical protein